MVELWKHPHPHSRLGLEFKSPHEGRKGNTEKYGTWSLIFLLCIWNFNVELFSYFCLSQKEIMRKRYNKYWNRHLHLIVPLMSRVCDNLSSCRHVRIQSIWYPSIPHGMKRHETAWTIRRTRNIDKQIHSINHNKQDVEQASTQNITFRKYLQIHLQNISQEPNDTTTDLITCIIILLIIP